MRKYLPFVSFLLATALFTSQSIAQQAGRFAYSMTDVKEQNNNWVYLRQLNMETGTYSDALLNGSAEKQVAFDAATKKQLSDFGVSKMGFNEQPAFSSGVAALAFDNKNNRLYYTPMFIDQLRYIDLKSMKVYYLTTPFTDKPVKSSDQGNIVTRMVIGSDGYGYAMTNDATQLLRFSTGKKVEVTDLGSIVDDQANKGISIHNSCSSFGGDMIADDDGNLYVFSARNNIFKVNIESRVATHLGTVSGLPANFTINGAAVNEKNQVLVASATESTSLYTIDTKTWVAAASKVNGTIWHTSDLASSNLLVSGKSKATTIDVVSRTIVPNSGDGKINIFPNPVTNNQFVIQFNQLETGNYIVLVTDVAGRQVIQQAITVGGENQSQTIKLTPATTKGIYLVKITDQNSKVVFSTKVVVQ